MRPIHSWSLTLFFVLFILLFSFVGPAASQPLESQPDNASVTGRAASGPAAAATGTTPEWECWAWPAGEPDPCQSHLQAVSMVSATDGWAVGYHGTILRWNGERWSRIFTSEHGRYYDVQMLGLNDGWIAGDGGFLRWNGRQWQEAGGSGSPFAIDMLSPTEGWSAGYGGVIQHWDGNSWQQVSTPTTAYLYGIEMRTADDGWAVGDEGTILHWDGVRWSTVTTPGNAQLFDVDVTDAGDAWAVGMWGAVYYWDGAQWLDRSLAAYDFTHFLDIHMVTPDDGWLVDARGDILHWDGISWQRASRPVYCPLNGLAVAPDGAVWSVGQWGNILRQNEGEWEHVAYPTRYSLSAVKMLTVDRGWAVGYDASHTADGVIIGWNGSEWREEVSTFGYLFDLEALSPSDVWAVGSSIWHKDETGWARFQYLDTNDHLYGIDFVAPDDGWAVGHQVDASTGEQYHITYRWDGGQWDKTRWPGNDRLRALSLLSSDNGWAVGDAGMMLRWDGSSWQNVPGPTGEDLLSVAMVSRDDGWATGKNGTILRWDGLSWQVVPFDGNHGLYTVSMSSATDGWIVGDAGLILHWDGTSWTRLHSPNQTPLYSVDMVAEDEGWIVGSGSSMLRYTTASKDTDGDGLADDWEIKGYDHDGDGNIDVNLPAMGADPLVKDLFVEVDYMVAEPTFCLGEVCVGGHSHRPKDEALSAVVQAFAEAPVENPDGSSGITLHVDYGFDSVMNPRTGELWSVLSRSNRLPHVDKFAMQLQYQTYNWWDFDEIKQTHFDPARAPIFHYSLWVHQLERPDRPCTSGASRGIPARDFIISLGGWDGWEKCGSGYEGNFAVGSARTQAGTFMHELGHNLGLKHGGGDHTNDKPHYLSVMNYLYQTRGIIMDGKDGYIGYSAWEAPLVLDENNLDESAGLPLGPYGLRYRCAGDEAARDDDDPASVDWNCQNGDQETGVRANVNDDLDGNEQPLYQQLSTHNDWANLVLDSYGASARHQPVEEAPLEELTPEEAARIPALYGVTVNLAAMPQVEGTSTTVTFEVTNQGRYADTFELALSTVWEVQAEPPETITLGPGETQMIAVTVLAYWREVWFHNGPVRLDATSRSHPLMTDSATTEIVLRPPGSGPAVFLPFVRSR